MKQKFKSVFQLFPYSVRMRKNAGKMRTRITPNKDTFYAVYKKHF